MEVNGVSTACFVAQTEYFEVVSNKKNCACQKGLLAVNVLLKVLLQHHDLIANSARLKMFADRDYSF